MRIHELSTNCNYRREMILWLAVRFARAGDWVDFDQLEKRFSTRVQLGDRHTGLGSTGLITDDKTEGSVPTGSQSCELSIRTSDSISIVIRTV